MATEYISREAAIKAIMEHTGMTPIAKLVAETTICRVSAADVRPVVLCRDCKYYKDGELLGPTKFCYFWQIGTGLNTADDDFCSKGERRADNG